MNKIPIFRSLFNNKIFLFVNKSSYVQGQSPEPKIREYFYFIDHQGMLFLDDSRMKNFTSCFKEKKFLEFFFRRIRLNKINRYQDEFPYISMCGKERNFIRCDDVPIVYTHLLKKEDTGKNIDLLSYGYATDLLSEEFFPNKIFMQPESGRVYHPCNTLFGGIGLLRDKLSIEVSPNFIFEQGENHPPTHFKWNGKIFTLEHQWFYERRKEFECHRNQYIKL